MHTASRHAALLFALLAAVSTAAACATAPAAPAQPAVAAAVPAACAQPFDAVRDARAAAAETQEVTIQGVVVGDYEGAAPALRGFYVQDGSTVAAGIFVFNGDRNDVEPGQLVRVTGRPGEQQGQRQVAADAVVVCGRGDAAPADIMLPLRAPDELARLEGMLVRLPQTLYVTDHYQLGRYGEVVLSSGAPLMTPTTVAAPGAAARAVQAANDLNRIVIDDASYEQNPATIVFARNGRPLGADNTLRVGDSVQGIVGVLTRTSGAGTSPGTWRVRPLNALHGGVPAFMATNPRTSAPPDVGGSLRVASFNVLNYFNSFGQCTGGVGGAVTDCRGADDAAEFERQAAKTVAAIVALDADVLGIIEMENDGYGPASAIADLVARLNRATAPGRYAFIDVDAATGTINALGSDAIKVGFLYRPARVSPVGRTAALNSAAFITSGESGPRHRAALAQAFAPATGGRVIVSVNHFKSKGSACDVPDAGDGQGNCSAARATAATRLLDWLATDPTATGEPHVLIIGDLNAYAREDPITHITRRGFTDLLARHTAGNAWTYVFNAQRGYLDHALASASLLPHITRADVWHINADEPSVLDYNTNFKSSAQQSLFYARDPFRSADHDPVIVGIDLARGGRTP